MRLLVAVAHPDDETFGCGSLLAHGAARGAETTVFCATRGEAGEATPGRGIDLDHLGTVREAELRVAAALLGVARVEVSGWTDSGMVGAASPTSLVAAPLDGVAVAVAEVIEDVRPHVVVTLDASDGHRDHVHMKDATRLAVERTTWRPARVYLQCLARSLMAQWAALLRAEHPGSDYLELGELGTPDQHITTVLDTIAYLELRWRAIAAHASQVSPYEAMPPDLQEAFLAVDRLRRVHPPWTGGPLEDDVFVSP